MEQNSTANHIKLYNKSQESITIKRDEIQFSVISLFILIYCILFCFVLFCSTNTYSIQPSIPFPFNSYFIFNFILFCFLVLLTLYTYNIIYFLHPIWISLKLFIISLLLMTLLSENSGFNFLISSSTPLLPILLYIVYLSIHHLSICPNWT